MTDVVALILALVARKLGRRLSSKKHTYGLGIIEVISASINGATIIVVGTLICSEAIIRLQNPKPVVSGLMLGVASIGLIANLISVFLLKGHSHTES